MGLRLVCLKFELTTKLDHYQLAPDSLVQVWKDTRLDHTMKSWEEYIRPIASQGEF